MKVKISDDKETEILSALERLDRKMNVLLQMWEEEAPDSDSDSDSTASDISSCEDTRKKEPLIKKVIVGEPANAPKCEALA